MKHRVRIRRRDGVKQRYWKNLGFYPHETIGEERKRLAKEREIAYNELQARRSIAQKRNWEKRNREELRTLIDWNGPPPV